MVSLMRVFILLITSFLLKRVTNPSMIYHWIRSQSLFKLYMIKAVNEILDRILKGYGQMITENFARAMIAKNDVRDRCTAVIAMIIYGLFHSFILSIEMFTIHVVLTSSQESIYSFLFYNNFTEMKIYVFKKVDIAGQYELAAVDMVERF